MRKLLAAGSCFLGAVFLVLVVTLVPCMVFWFCSGNSRGLRDGVELEEAGVRIQVDDDTMDVESFLISMISVDYQSGMDEEALKAFAVAARSSLYAHLEKCLERKPDQLQEGSQPPEENESPGQGISVVEADELGISFHEPGEMILAFQEVAGMEGENHWSVVYEHIKKAADATAGEYLVYPEESETMPVDVPWHEISSGNTRFYEGNLTGNEDGISIYCPQLKSMDGKDGTLSRAVTITVYGRRELAELLWEIPGTENILSEGNALSSYFIIENRDETGYIEKISLGNRKMTGDEAAQLLQVSSGCFYISDMAGDRLKIVAFGSGRGYGMSLAGASLMALQGMNYAEILEYYFPVCRLNNSIVFRAE